MANDTYPWDEFPEDLSTWEQCLKERSGLVARIQKLEEALKWYAKPSIYEEEMSRSVDADGAVIFYSPDVLLDEGNRAIEALEE